VRVLLDENVPFELMLALEARGHEVAHVAQDHAQACDEDVLARAVAEERVLVTFDSDFGRLIFYERRDAPIGLVYLQSEPDGAPQVIARLVEALDRESLLPDGRYIVIDQKGGVRNLPLPQRIL
jgi:predicted nuclease of predicted toxin-antitoxin system